MTRHVDADPTIGDRIRTARLARGWSIRHAADRAGLAPSTWSRIERGLRGADNRFILHDIAAALGCTASDLTGRPAVAVDPVIAAADSRIPAVLAALIEADPDQAPDRPARSLAELERAVELARDLYRRVDHAGLTRLLPDLLLDLHAAATGPDRRAVLALQVQTALACLGPLKHLGHQAAAYIAAERGRQAAAALRDPVASALAEFAASYAANELGGYRRAYTISERAVATLRPRARSGRGLEALGLLTLRLGHAAAGLHRPDEAVAAMDEAQRIADRTGEAHSWDMAFGPQNARVWRMVLETDAGDPGRAVAMSQRINPAVFPAIRQAAFHLDAARAFTAARRDTEAVRALLTAERLAPQRTRVDPLARETTRQLLGRTRPGGLAGFAERVGLAVP